MLARALIAALLMVATTSAWSGEILHAYQQGQYERAAGLIESGRFSDARDYMAAAGMVQHGLGGLQQDAALADTYLGMADALKDQPPDDSPAPPQPTRKKTASNELPPGQYIKLLTPKESAGIAFENAVKAVAKEYPYLDSARVDADQSAIAEVVRIRNEQISTGKPAHEALWIAARQVAGVRAASAQVPAATLETSPSAAASDGDYTGIFLLVFVGIVWWLYYDHNKLRQASPITAGPPRRHHIDPADVRAESVVKLPPIPAEHYSPRPERPPAPAPLPPSFVYVFLDGMNRTVKVGMSKDPHSRVVQVAAELGCEPLEVSATFRCESSDAAKAVEKRSHAELDPFRINRRVKQGFYRRNGTPKDHQGEWFTVSVGEAVEAIEYSASALNQQIQRVL